MPRIISLASLALGASLLLVACTGGSAASVPPASTSTSMPTASATSPASSGPAAGAKVNANSASEAELAAAFAAAGVPSADRWAKEVAEYRPYPSDPSWAQLRQELGKYNIDPAVLEQIIVLLEV